MQFTIRADQSGTPLHPYWKKCVGSCHAAMALREDWRRQMRKCKEELGFEYVRFHGLLDDDMSVCQKVSGDIEYSFFNVDSIFDFLLGIGMKPFIELSFMPEVLSSGTKTVFHYKGNITPPKSYEAWAELIERLTRHLVDRYGLEEVRQWFFEVWNEPNLSFFWAGTQEEYFELYRHAALAVKKVDSVLPAGGPATACNAWIPELKEFCARQNVPLDFISTHHYPTDAALGHGLDMEAQMARSKRGVCLEMVQKALEEAGDLPLYYTEWSNSPSARDSYHDDPYAAAFVLKTVADNIGLIDCYSFWTFSDIFEESGFSSPPFHGGFGLLNIHGIPKPTYRAFQLLSRLGEEKLAVTQEGCSSTVECLASRAGDALTILVYNHNIPLAPIREETVQLLVTGVRDVQSVTLERIDQHHANAKRLWMEMGKPEYPSRDQLQELMEASEMETEPIAWERSEDGITLKMSVPAHGVAAITISL